VQLAIPASIQPQISSALLEAIWLLLDEQNGAIAETAAELVESKLEKSDALVLGPGLGRDVTTARFVERLLLGKKEIRGKAMGFVPGEPEPDSAPTALPKFVIDADGLQLLAEIPDWSKRLRGSGVLTPHPGEMAALTGMTAGEVQADREALALRFAREWNQVVVLKGALSVIAEPGGRSVIIPVATSALAKAGSGDVLSGVIGGLMAQGAAPFEAAVAGAWYHAQAGLQAAKRLGSERSVLAGDVIEALASVMA
jgi:NAD(P)H-hydrate epimerase